MAARGATFDAVLKQAFRSPYTSVLLFGATAAFIGVEFFADRYSGFLLSAMAIGGGVGAVELMGRYRQAPVRAVLSMSGFVFVFVNLCASALAWYLLHALKAMSYLGTSPEPPYAIEANIKAALVAGFGALVFLRSSIFRVRIGESDIGIGPAAFLDSLLLIADRGVDRWAALGRAREVARLVSRLKEPLAVARLLGKYGLALMQNVDQKTIDDLNDAIGKILNDPATDDAIKTDIVALRLGVVLGGDVLEAAALTLNDRLIASAKPAASFKAEAALENEIRSGYAEDQPRV